VPVRRVDAWRTEVESQTLQRITFAAVQTKSKGRKWHRRGHASASVRAAGDGPALVAGLLLVFSIPKILRRFSLYDRSLLSELGRCVWESLKMFLRETVPQRGAVPRVFTSIQQ
jgi:hypothetical protein